MKNVRKTASEKNVPTGAKRYVPIDKIKEVTHINELTPKLQNGVKSQASSFAEFMSKYSIVPVAVGIVMGQATKDVVDSLVTGIISPFIAILTPNTKLENFKLEIFHTGSNLLVGSLIDSLIKFIIIAIFIYVTIGILLKKLSKPEEEKK